MCRTYLILSHIRQICSRRLWKCLLKNIEHLFKCRYNYCKKLKRMWQKEKLLVLSRCFQKSSAADMLKCVYSWERVNSFLHSVAFWHIGSRRLLKTLWEMEKLHIMRNFSSCHNVFNSIILLSFIEDVHSFKVQRSLLQICWKEYERYFGCNFVETISYIIWAFNEIILSHLQTHIENITGNGNQV